MCSIDILIAATNHVQLDLVVHLRAVGVAL
jgi:hypothetical protein